jgi:hypothetical protein
MPWNALERLGMPWNALECLGYLAEYIRIHGPNSLSEVKSSTAHNFDDKTSTQDLHRKDRHAKGQDWDLGPPENHKMS